MSIQRCGQPAQVSGVELESEADLFKALSDHHRLTVLAILARAEGEVCVCEFTDALELNQPTVSHHLRLLREAKLVTSERRGTWVYYRLAPDAMELLRGAIDVVEGRTESRTPKTIAS